MFGQFPFMPPEGGACWVDPEPEPPEGTVVDGVDGVV